MTETELIVLPGDLVLIYLCGQWGYLVLFSFYCLVVYFQKHIMKMLFFKCFNFFYYCSRTVVSIFPLALPPPQPSLPPTLNPMPLPRPWLCPCVLYRCSWKPFYLCPCIPSHLPSGYCQFVPNFNISGYILLTCLFCWLGSTYRWDHVVFVFHCLAYLT